MPHPVRYNKIKTRKGRKNMNALSPRQIHLDFHTSEHIPDVGSSFDPVSFAKTVKEASVSSMTVFARCHHGWLYYPSKKFPELVHPNLKYKNLLVDQVRALHKEGINAPVYITVQWDYQSAITHPEWLIRKRDGSHEGGAFTDPGFYQSLCVNTGYFEFLKEQTAEVCELLGDELDGIFFDIVSVRPCLCAACRKEMQELSIDASNDVAVRDFSKAVLDRFKEQMTEHVRKYNKNCTVFYNAGHIGTVTKKSSESYTHFELESLPSGSWGYLHFPSSARYARKLGKDCMGMTGKFHTEWGDFHSFKNLAALEFECFRMLSYGFAASIGDQLEPNGALNPATYRLVGKVYSQFAEREAWARPSRPLVEAAVLTSEPVNGLTKAPKSILGATQMLEELAIQFDIIDSEMPLEEYKLVILPDDFIADDAFTAKLEDYVKAGGKVIATAKGGQNHAGEYPSVFGAVSLGANKVYPDFLIANGEKISDGLDEGIEYVIYNCGQMIRPTSAQTIMYARAPHFKRGGSFFCSHRYTPSAKGESYPAVLKNGNVILFAHPMFEQYRDNAPLWCKKLISNAIDILIDNRIVKHNGPSTMSISVLDQEDKGRTNLHILTYIPVRKSATIDIIEERTVQRNVTVTFNLDRKITSARLVPENIPLKLEGNSVTVPEINGYAIVELS